MINCKVHVEVSVHFHAFTTFIADSFLKLQTIVNFGTLGLKRIIEGIVENI
jgi:hypothetical protein